MCNVSQPHCCPVTVWSSMSLLIQHLSHLEQHLYSWPFWEEFKSISPHMLYRKYVDTSVCSDTGNTQTPRRGSDISPHTAGFCPASSASPWEMTQGQPSHRGVKYTPPPEKQTGGGRGVVWLGQWGGKEVSTWVWSLEMENAEGNVCARRLCGEQSGCWLESLSAERWNWSGIVWTFAFRRRRRRRVKRVGVLLKVGVEVVVNSWPWDRGSVTPHISSSRSGLMLKRGVGSTFVTVEGWGLTRHTSISDKSEQLAGRPRLWWGLTLAICSFRARTELF